MLKKRIAWIMIFVFILNIMTLFTVVTATEMNTDKANVEQQIDLKDANRVKKLTAIGVIEPFDINKLYTNIKRSEIAAIMFKYLDMVEDFDTKTPFVDVLPSDKNIGIYNALYKAGFITGDDGRRFRPDDYTTYNESVILVINAMGYKPLFSNSDGYLNIAMNLNITRKVSHDSVYISYNDLFIMLENSLEVKCLRDSKIEDDVGTILEEYFSTKEIKGIVTGNENTRLYTEDSSKIKMNQLEIEGVVYNTPDSICADVLGKEVVAYIQEDEDDEFQIVYMNETSKNDILKIDAYDILPNKVTERSIYYIDENDKIKHIDVDFNMLSVIYNGKNYSNYGLLRNIIPDNGYIVCIDNDNDGKTEVLLVFEYKNVFVGSVNLHDNIIVDKYTDEEIPVDEDEDEVRVYSSDGELGTLSLVSSDTLICIAESKNTKGYKLINIYICDNVIEGKIDSIDGEEKCEINGVVYEFANSLKKLDEDGVYLLPSLGTEATFYTDINGKIAMYEHASISGDAKFAVISKVYNNETENELVIKLFNQDGEWCTFRTMEKIRIDGTSYKDYDRAEAAITPYIGEVIRYAVKDKNTISFIDTAAPNKGNLNKKSDNGNLNQFISGTQFEHRIGMCNEYNKAYENKFSFTPDSVYVFYVPETGQYNDIDGYSVGRKLIDGYYGTTEGNSWVRVKEGYKVYNTLDADINVAEAILLKGCDSTFEKSITSETELSVVSGFTVQYDEYDDTVCNAVSYWSSGGVESTSMCEEEVAYTYTLGVKSGSETRVPFEKLELKIGDIVQFTKNSKNKIAKINVVYRFDQNAISNTSTAEKMVYLKDLAFIKYPEYQLTFGANSGDGAAIGEVVKIDVQNQIMRFEVAGKEYDIKMDQAKIGIYDKYENTLTPVSLQEIMKEDRVIVKTCNRWFAAKAFQVIILR